MACYNCGDLNLSKIQGESMFEAVKNTLKYKGTADNINDLLAEINEPDYIIEVIEI